MSTHQLYKVKKINYLNLNSNKFCAYFQGFSKQKGYCYSHKLDHFISRIFLNPLVSTRWRSKSSSNKKNVFSSKVFKLNHAEQGTEWKYRERFSFNDEGSKTKGWMKVFTVRCHWSWVLYVCFLLIVPLMHLLPVQQLKKIFKLCKAPINQHIYLYLCTYSFYCIVLTILTIHTEQLESRLWEFNFHSRNKPRVEEFKDSLTVMIELIWSVVVKKEKLLI